MSHELRSTAFVRALVVACGALLPACAGSTNTTDGGGADIRAACECCPTGDWSGNCAMNPMLADASHAPTPPPDGSRWCNATESQQNACQIAGPMLPPELSA
jgi:predicted small secreted protein